MIYDEFHSLFDKRILIFLSFSHPTFAFCGCPERQTIQPLRRKHSHGPWHLRCAAKQRSYQWITSPPKPLFSDMNYDDTYSPQYWWHIVLGDDLFLGDFWFLVYTSHKKLILHQIPTRRLVQIRCSKIVSGCFLSGFCDVHLAVWRETVVCSVHLGLYGCRIDQVKQKHLWNLIWVQ